MRAAVVVALSAGWAAAQPARPGDLSIAGYINWIDRVSAEIGDGQAAVSPSIVGDIPPSWRIRTEAGSFDVSNGALIRDLRALATKPDPLLHTRVREELLALRRGAAGFEAPPANREPARARLLQILDDQEFQGIHGPTWRDRLRQQILQIVQSLLERLAGSSAIPTLSDILVYVLVAFAVIVLALWAYAVAGRGGTHPIDRAGTRGGVSRAWQIWFADAQKAAARGDWREAIHLVYWCGVSFLEARSAWAPDRARTPREYLRLLAASSEHRPALTDLTKNFELVWSRNRLCRRQPFRRSARESGGARVPAALSPGDRRLFLGAGVLLVVLVGGTALLTEGAGNVRELPSSYSVASGGAKAAYRLLTDSGYEVERWEQSLTALPNGEGTTLILAEPESAPTRETSVPRSCNSSSRAALWWRRACPGACFSRNGTWHPIRSPV